MTDEIQGTVLIVEDDEPTRTFIADNLNADGYEPILAGDARDGMRALESKYPDAAIIDVGLPGASGLELVAGVRAADGLATRVNPQIPILVLSGQAQELDRLRAFERGCDDFLAKPFSYPELRARLTALVRRTERRGLAGRLRIGELELDPAARTVSVAGVPVALSQKEYALLRALASDPTRVFTKQELLRTIWGYRSIGTTRTLDSHACRLRGKLSIGGLCFVINVWGVGYRLVDGVEAPASAQMLQEVAA